MPNMKLYMKVSDDQVRLIAEDFIGALTEFHYSHTDQIRIADLIMVRLYGKENASIPSGKVPATFIQGNGKVM